MAPTRSETAEGIRSGRQALVQDATVVGASLRLRLTAFYDEWLTRLLPPTDGLALVAVGSLARGEVAPYGDIDLVIVHSGLSTVAKLADEVWYPLWDAGVSLDHSVRTVDEAVRLAGDDLAVGLGLVAARTVAGDAELGTRLRERVRAQWRRGGRRRAAELAEGARERAERYGELAFLVEPDLKLARGGLRDVRGLQGLAIAQLCDPPTGAIATAYELLLDVRGELHRRAGRALDRLVHQEQGPIAATLGLGDADGLLRSVSDAGRTIAYGWDSTVRTLTQTPGRFRRGSTRRRPLADGVVDHDGEVVLARDADRSDPALPLRVAAAAAAARRPISPFTLDRLVAGPPMPEPWPAAARDALVALLAAGRAAVPVIEGLDRAGLLTRLLPEWERVRSRPQRDPVHTFTVDRHLIETAAHAADRVREVARPDLLLLAALLHDIGKGSGGDHSVAGERIAAGVVGRLGLPEPDARIVTAAVRHHLLLPDTATRRDLDDPSTVRLVVDRIGGSPELLEILHALAVADGQATGPAAWGGWKAGLVGDLVARVRRALHGASVPPAPDPAPALRHLAASREVAVLIEGSVVTVAAPQRPGLLSGATGVLALHHLDVRAATITEVRDVAVDVFTVAPRFGAPPAAERLRADLRRALAGALPLADRLAALEDAYPVGADAPPQVLWFDDESSRATVVELRAANAIGLLHRVTEAFERCGVQVRAARISTLGSAVVDAFYVVGPDGAELTDGALRGRVERALFAAAAHP